jgi:hypothetical protein
MRLSLRESRMRGRGKYCVVGNPGDAGANMGHPYSAVVHVAYVCEVRVVSPKEVTDWMCEVSG